MLLEQGGRIVGKPRAQREDAHFHSSRRRSHVSLRIGTATNCLRSWLHTWNAMPGGPDSKAREHIPALDGYAAWPSCWSIPHNADIFSNSAPWLWPMALLAHAGWIGVQLFFVLSAS
jgi:hypothetical protein